MATHAPITGAADCARPIKLSPDQRAVAVRSIETLIALLDADDGDPDLELDGDELDGCGAEDEAGHHCGNDGPGCPIADAAEPMLAATEEYAGRWGSNLVMGRGDDGEEPDDPAGRRRHINRIRRERCVPCRWQGLPAYQLKPEQPREREILRLRWSA